MSRMVVEGSVIDIKGGFDHGDADTDPAVLESAIGVTWDALDTCLAYGLSAAQAKALLTAPKRYQRGPHGPQGNGLAGDHGGVEQGVGGVSGQAGIMPEVGDRLVHQDCSEDLVDRRPRGVRRIVGQSLVDLLTRVFGLQPVHEGREPGTFAAVAGQLAQDRDGNGTQGVRLRIVARHRTSPHLVPTFQAQIDRARESGRAA